MNIKKTIYVTITKEEREILKKAENILTEICDAFSSKCEECPLNAYCGGSLNGRSVATILYHCIHALPLSVED